jgi:hypothetical protein
MNAYNFEKWKKRFVGRYVGTPYAGAWQCGALINGNGKRSDSYLADSDGWAIKESDIASFVPSSHNGTYGDGGVADGYDSFKRGSFSVVKREGVDKKGNKFKVKAIDFKFGDKNTYPKIGDIAFFRDTGAQWGHVAVVNRVSPDGFANRLETIDQNLPGNSKVKYNNTTMDNSVSINKWQSGWYRFKLIGVLRKELITTTTNNNNNSMSTSNNFHIKNEEGLNNWVLSWGWPRLQELHSLAKNGYPSNILKAYAEIDKLRLECKSLGDENFKLKQIIKETEALAKDLESSIDSDKTEGLSLSERNTKDTLRNTYQQLSAALALMAGTWTVIPQETQQEIINNMNAGNIFGGIVILVTAIASTNFIGANNLNSRKIEEKKEQQKATLIGEIEKKTQEATSNQESQNIAH